MWWLLARSTTGFQFRTVGANPNAARTAGISVGRTWILAMLLAGGLAGLSGAVTIQGTFYSLNFQSYGNYGIDGITVALLGRAKPLGVVLAGLLFGALDAGSTVMQAATSVPVDITEVIQGLIVLFVAAPPLIRGDVPAPPGPGHRAGSGREGMERMSALAAVTTVRTVVNVNRRLIAAAVFVLFGLIDILVFGFFAHKGDATFALSLPTSSFQVPSIHAPAAPVSYVLGGLSILIGVARAAIDEPAWARRLGIGAVLLFFVISLLCWADTGSWANDIPVNVVSLLQNTLTASIPLILGALAGCMGERSGVINIAIEGQLLLGAFTAAVVASAVGVLWLGLISGSLAGGLVGLILALFAIRWLVDQIILGVVLNLLISGLTGLPVRPAAGAAREHLQQREHVQRGQDPRTRQTSRSSGRSSSTRRSSSTSPTRRSSRSRSACSAPAGGCGSARWASTRRPPTRSGSRSTASGTATSSWAGCWPGSAART